MFALKTAILRLYIKILKLVVYLTPVNMPFLFSGKGSHIQLARVIERNGVKNVMLVTDKGLSDIGLYNQLISELNLLGITVNIFDEITPDPTDSQVNRGVEKLIERKCDAVIGFGGGSAMDAAKLISVLPIVDKPLSKLVGVFKVRSKGLPLYLIPTTAGTGSEVTIAAVVTDSKSGQKLPVTDPVLVPIATALDPELMIGLPERVTASSGFDALTHAIEAYISTNATSETDDRAKNAIKLIWENIETAVREPDNIAARESMAFASYYAGLAFSKAGLGYAHGIAHQLGALYHVPHGEANALVLPHVLAFSNIKVTAKLSKLARHLGIDGESDKQLASRIVDGIFRLQESLGLPQALPQLKKKDYKPICRNALREAHRYYAVPRYMSKRDCYEVLDEILVND